MATLADYNVTPGDWRAQLRRNRARTRWVVGIFIGLYLAIGLLLDTYFASVQYPSVPLTVLGNALLTGQLLPAATILTGIIAVGSLLLTYSFYDRIVLLGTKYREITRDTAATLAEQQLLHSIEELQIAVGLRYRPRLYIIAAEYMNAFASGYSERSALIAVTSGLLAKLNREEIQAVLAHELSHIRHGDVKLTLMATVMANILLLAVDLLFYNLVFGREQRRERSGLVTVITLLRYLLPFMTAVLTLYLSRAREYMADAGCVELLRDNAALASALPKIHVDHAAQQPRYAAQYNQTAHEDVRRAAYLYDPAQCGIQPLQSLANLFSTHPDLSQRLRALGVLPQTLQKVGLSA